MVAVGGLVNALLVAALTTDAFAEPELLAPGELPATPDATIELSSQTQMQACESGGMGAGECDVTCRVVFNFMTTSCGVSCRSGYFACCSCDNGCKCLMDHEEMWPIPDPGPKLQ